MLDIHIAQHWVPPSDYLAQIRTWRWFREAVPSVMSDLVLKITITERPSVDMQALGRAFWAWVAVLDNIQNFEPLEPEDHAHFASGVLLAYLLKEWPLEWLCASRSQKVMVLTQTAMTLLSSWRSTIGASPLSSHIIKVSEAQWNSYVENITENSDVAVAFLDFFTSREPCWQFPFVLTGRPAFAKVLAKHQIPPLRV